MVCDSWKTKLDSYLDGELPEQDARAVDAHVRGCASCSADALAAVQMKRAIHVAGQRFSPSPDFRRRVQQSITTKPPRTLRWGWVYAVAMTLIIAVGILTFARSRRGEEQILSEVADLHVTTMASASPVDVISTDRHTVKPWFQGRIPFAFNLPELQNTDFVLVGGRVAYLEQAPGAHLIYDLRKHHISVFIFQESALRRRLGDTTALPRQLPFSMETWSQGGLRYFVVGDASSGDLASLATLFKATGT